ncbi:histidine phosphatase family protein [Erythrobacter sp. KMU-140]|uniref:Histidine phosphatase family protein n=2 Tax=Erythrobacter rubeus TaxID=2760803 RepID=A0ABR8KSE6_9SPHN|nr:histidine phosphatase family protein [Erythrobacter rubeus]
MFVIVRHGNTFESGEKPRRIGARTDLPLTATGVDQAAALGRHFVQKGWQFVRVLVSPLARTRQTAEAALSHFPNAPDLEFADFLKEIDHGPDENKTESEVIDRIGDHALKAWDETAQVPSDWVVDPESRMTAWRELFAANSDADGATLLVTSNGAARFALLADESLLGDAVRLGSLKLPTGGYGAIVKDDEGVLRLAEWGVRP